MQEIHSVEILSNSAISLMQMITYARVERAVIIDMVEAGLLEPIDYRSDNAIEQWQFAACDLRKLRAAQRLVHDLGVNLAGAALILDLRDERDALLSRVALFQQMLDGG